MHFPLGLVFWCRERVLTLVKQHISTAVVWSRGWLNQMHQVGRLLDLKHLEFPDFPDMNFQLRETLLFISFPLLIMLMLTVLKSLPAGAVWETSVSSKPRVGDITQVRGQTIRHPLVSALCRGFSLSPVFPKLSQRVGTMKLSCVTPTQQQWLLSFCSQSTAISVASASVFVCGGDTHTHTHTHTHIWQCLCVLWGGK